MNNKKIIVLIAVIVLLVCAVVFGIYKATHNENYMYDSNGNIVDGREELIEHLRDIEDAEERKKQIDFSVESNIITQGEANELY